MTKVLRIDKCIDTQLIADWCEELGVTNIIIANDEIADDGILSTIIKLSLPHHLKIAIKEVAVTGELLKDKLCDHIRILVIVKNPRDALYIYKAAGCLNQIIVGDFNHFQVCKDNSNQDDRAYCSSKTEYELFQEIIKLVPDTTCQAKTTDQAVLLKEFLC